MTLVKERIVPFTIDAKASLFTVQAFAAGMVAVVAHSPKFAVRDFSGDISFNPENPERSSVNLSITTGSLEILDEVRASDRREIDRIMFDEVLEKSRYPKITSKSSHVSATIVSENVFRLTVSGDLCSTALPAECVSTRKSWLARNRFAPKVPSPSCNPTTA
jgi:polyisoprenoid-binding protein YceI